MVDKLVDMGALEECMDIYKRVVENGFSFNVIVFALVWTSIKLDFYQMGFIESIKMGFHQIHQNGFSLNGFSLNVVVFDLVYTYAKYLKKI